MISTPCVIFAGGKSSRMGEDKSLLPFGSFSTLTEYQYSRLSKIFQNVYISCKNKSKFHFSANFIEDKIDISLFAPTAGFDAIFNTLSEEKIFVISVDTPFVALEQINTLFKMDNDLNDATIAKTDAGVQPLCGIYHRSLKEKFEEMLKNKNHKLGFLLKNSNTTYVYFENENPFLNLNHPHEYEAALKLI